MSAGFASAESVQNLRIQAEAIQPTPDFLSFLGSVSSGRIATQEELEARLRATNGYARKSNGVAYRDNDSVLVDETRRVNPDEADVVRGDFACRQSIAVNGANAAGTLNFSENTLQGAFVNRDEFMARLRATNGYAREPNGSTGYRDDDSRLVSESRSVSAEQATILLDLFDASAETRITQRAVSDTGSFLRDISSRQRARFSLEELEARVRAKGGYARNSKGAGYRDSAESLVVETRSVRREDAALVLSEFQSVGQVEQAAQQARDCTSYLRNLLEGSITSQEELSARLRATNGYAREPNGSTGYRDSDDDLVSERRSVSAEQARILLEIQAILPATGSYRGSLTRELLGGGDGSNTLRNIDSDYLKPMTRGDVANILSFRENVDNIVRFSRRAAADERILTTIVATEGDIGTVFRLISEDAERDNIDRDQAVELTSLCYQRRRSAFTTQIFSELANTDASILLPRVNEFATSPDPADKERALVLTRYIYDLEIKRDQTRLIAAALQEGVQGYDALAGSLTFRPDIEGFNYTAALTQREERLRPIIQMLSDARIDQRISETVRRFDRATPAQILDVVSEISAIQNDTDTAAQALLEYYKLYLTNRRFERRADYETVFSFEVEALRRQIAPEYQFIEGLGTNISAAKELADQFRSVILPLYESLKGEPGFGELLDDVMGSRDLFTIDIHRLAEQRELTENEVAYLRSVKALSAFNPYIISIARGNPGLAFAYLESYFAELSETTAASFFQNKSGEIKYVPLLQVGTGPNGIASLGEIMRKRPDLISQTLVIDEQDWPGGPFAIPKGPAWNLNSANLKGFEGYAMPDLPRRELIGKTVREYASPVRWYPGERPEGVDNRPGSINMATDYLPSADEISDERYPDNEQEALTLQLQAAILAKNYLRRTKLIGIEELPESTEENPLFLATMYVTDESGKGRIEQVTTSGVITGSGLGVPTYGFNLEGSRAERVLQQQPQIGFPKLTTTLPAFKALSSRETRQPKLGQTFVVYGNGNSADTLIEYLGGLFESGNRNIRNIRKIYIVTDGSLSRRPRYAQIADLLRRNGNEGLVEIIEGRVGDVDFVEPTNIEGKLKLFNTDGNVIVNGKGEEIAADHVVAATGFRPEIASVFRGVPGAVETTSRGDTLVVESVSLPTNPNVAVAQTLRNRRNFLFIGTGSLSGFNVRDKLLQLPERARQALLRNGPENAVALGFRVPDAQTATRLFLEENDRLGREVVQRSKKPRRRLIDASEGATRAEEGASVVIRANTPSSDLPSLRNDVDAGSEALTPLLLRSLGTVKLVNAAREATYSFKIRLNNGQSQLIMGSTVPADIAQLVAASASNPYFQAYAQEALRVRRNSNEIDVSLRFTNGRLAFKDSYVQAA